MAIGLITFDDGSRREDLTDILTNLSPQETPLLSGLQEGPDAQNPLHEYVKDTFAAAADNAAAEAVGFTVTDHTAPSRAVNIVQNFFKHIQVSDDQVRTRHGGNVDNAFEYQIGKNLTELAKDVELALMRGSKASGNSGVARRLEGVINGISTNSTTRSSGSSLGETTFNDIIAMVKDDTDEVPDEIYVGTQLRRDISGFSGNSNSRLNIPADDKRLVNSIDVYVSDFGMHKIFWHRNVNNAANAKELVAIRRETWALSFMVRPGVQRLPMESADRQRAQAWAKLTLENRFEQANAVVDGFTG